MSTSHPFSPQILTVAEVRAAEAAMTGNGIDVNALMERAGSALAEAVWRFGAGQETLVLCGPGNNGGDGYVAARMLADRGMHVTVAALGEPKSDACRAARANWTGRTIPFEEAVSAPVIVDALYGTGLSRPLNPDVVSHLRHLAQMARLVIAVDVPSGVDSDTGAHLGAVQAHVTLAMGALKPAHVLLPAAAMCGNVQCCDIGLGVSSKSVRLGRPTLMPPRAADHKYTRGLVSVVAGDMPGAALLAATAAQRSGAGYVVLAGDKPGFGGTMALVRRNVDEVLADERTSVIVIGPGLGRGISTRRLLDRVIDSEQALVMDADALQLIHPSDFKRFTRRNAPVILTPHAGEFAALFGTEGASKIDRTYKAALDSGCKIIFKGADTVIASNDGRVAVSTSSPAWLATAGTGDVLAGIVGALLGQGMGAFEASCAAVWLQGDAARRAGPALIADDLCDHLPAAIAACL